MSFSEVSIMGYALVIVLLIAFFVLLAIIFWKKTTKVRTWEEFWDLKEAGSLVNYFLIAVAVLWFLSIFGGLKEKFDTMDQRIQRIETKIDELRQKPKE